VINLDTGARQEHLRRHEGRCPRRPVDRLQRSIRRRERGTKPNEPRRTIKTIKSLPEVSLVTFPMNELARTGSVKMTETANSNGCSRGTLAEPFGSSGCDQPGFQTF